MRKTNNKNEPNEKAGKKNKLILQKRDKKPLTKKLRRAIISMFWGYGSVGRAPRSQRGGQRFESAYLHQVKPKLNHLWFDLGFLFFDKSMNAVYCSIILLLLTLLCGIIEKK